LRRATQKDIHATERTAINGLQPWTEKGIAGRGVLIDFAAHAEQNGTQVSHFSPHAITLEEILEIAKRRNIEFRTGDILLVRTGYVSAYKALHVDRHKEVASIREWIGVGQSREMTEWLWQRQFAAVVSDSPGFEVRRTFSILNFSYDTDGDA
jgi:hypothetical protein